MSETVTGTTTDAATGSVSGLVSGSTAEADTRPRAVARLLVILAVFALLASACVGGSDDSTDANGGDDAAETDGDESGDADADGGVTADGDGDDEADSGTGDLPVGAIADPAALSMIEEVACSFDEPVPLSVRPTCHEVTVPENWAEPDDAAQVVLQVAVFDGDGSDADPVIYFDGGPGGHTLDTVSFTFDTLIDPLLSTRDFILFDQRGVGLSEPSLACPELTELSLAELAGEIADDEIAQASADAQAACRDRLLTSADLTNYNSVSSANDVDAIRALLGYEQLNVVGISYGTRLAQTYMRMFPDSIRSVTLDSVFPTGYDLWTNFDPSAVRAFEQLFDGCAADEACAEAHPELRDRFFELLDQLDEEPAEVEVRDLLTGATVDAIFDGDDVFGMVFGALYDQSRFAAVPQMVEESLAGDYSTIQFFGSVDLTNLDFVSTGLQLSVECNEEIAFESEEEYLANAPTDEPYDRLVDLDDGQSFFDLCGDWPSGEAPEVESEGIVSDIPTLVLAGQYDPITPPAGADLVREGLSNSYSFLFPHEGHGITPTDCGAEIVDAFIGDPATEPDSSCIATAPEPVWVAPGVGEITLVEFEETGLVSIAGLRPEDWTDSGNGVFSRQQTATDPTLLLIQPTSGVPEDTLVNLIASQLDIELLPTDPLNVDGTEWSAFESPAASGQAASAAIKPGTDGVVVLLVARADELEPLYDAMFEEVAAAASAG